MQKQKSIRNRSIIPNTHYLVYKDKKYPIKIGFFKYSSKYFEKNENELNNMQDIPLLHCPPEHERYLTDDTINAFIEYSQGEEIIINNENLIGLKILSELYEVLSLKTSIFEYINENEQELLFEIIETTTETEIYENILVEHLTEYIEDERFLNLKISTIQRIIQSYINDDNRAQNEKESFNKKLIEILFKLLDKHGKNASVLFNEINFEKENLNVINRLIENYSQIFDFNMINSTLAKTTIYLSNELKKQQEQMKQIYNNMNDVIESQKQQLEKYELEEQKLKKELKDQEEQSRLHFTEEIERIKNSNSLVISTFENKMHEIFEKEEKLQRESIIKKYQQIIMEMINVNNFNELSLNSKSHIINEIIHYPNQQEINKNIAIQRVLYCNQLFNRLSNKKVDLISFIDENINEIKLNSEYVEYLLEQDLLSKEIKDVMKIFDQFIIEIKYRSKLYDSNLNIISYIKKELKDDKAKIKISLVIEDYDFYLHDNEYNELFDIYEINFDHDVDEKMMKNFQKMKEIKILSETTIIQSSSFENCSLLRKITIPQSVTSIESKSFKGCSSLTDIQIPSSVKSIGKYAFEGCSSLKQIILPSIEIIEEDLFKGCTMLNQLTIPPSVKCIEQFSFSNCKSLSSVSIPSTVLSIGEFCFESCEELKEIMIDPYKTTIQGNTFKDCINLNHFTNSSNIIINEEEKNEANKEEKDETEEEEEEAEEEKESIFTNTEIDRTVFNKAEGNIQLSILNLLKSTKHDENATKIQSAIHLLTYLYEKTKTNNIKSSFIEIEQDAQKENIFIKCNNTEFFYENKVFDSGEFSAEIDNFPEIYIEIKYPSNNFENIYQCINQIKSLNSEKIFICIFITGIINTDKYFQDNKAINYIIIDSTVNKISNESFAGCSSITGIKISSSINTIEQFSFNNCTSLNKISFPSSITSIKNHAFQNCTSLIHVSIPNSINSIERAIFLGSSLIEITIPSSVKSIGEYSFQKCFKLRKITIPSSVISIGKYALSKCTSLCKISLPSSLTSIEEGLFWASSIKKITIPSSVTSIQKKAFLDCSSLIDITISSSVKSIGTGAFRRCHSLRQITIPSSLNTNKIGLNSSVKIIRI